VPGACEEARRVKTMNEKLDRGDFELMIVTSDDRHHVVAPSPAAMTALVALAQADTVLVWDPADRRLICREPARHDPPDGRPSHPGYVRRPSYDTITVPAKHAPTAEYVTVVAGKIVHSHFVFDRLPFREAA
jgi:hypothetical protein